MQGQLSPRPQRAGPHQPCPEERPPLAQAEGARAWEVVRLRWKTQRH